MYIKGLYIDLLLQNQNRDMKLEKSRYLISLVLNLPNAATLSTVPHVLTPNQKIVSLLLHNYNFLVINCNVNVFWRERFAKGVVTHKLRNVTLYRKCYFTFD